MRVGGWGVRVCVRVCASLGMKGEEAVASVTTSQSSASHNLRFRLFIRQTFIVFGFALI